MMYVENLLPEEFYKEIQDVLFSHKFPWYHNEVTSIVYAVSDAHEVKNYFVDENTVDTQQFAHHFVVDGQSDSQYTHYITRMIPYIERTAGQKFKAIHRIKTNMLCKDGSYPDNCYHTPHIDSVKGISGTKTFLYYVNDSDGDTYFFNEIGGKSNPERLTLNKRITPRANSGVLFDTNVWHASSTPRVSNRRIVINFILYE